MSKIVIVGNGIAGITAARHLRKNSSNELVVISSESKYFFSRTALMYVYMGHMKFEHIQPYENWFWEKNKIDLIEDSVDSIEITKKSLTLASGKLITYDKLILALGSKPRSLQIAGAELKGVQSLYSKQDLELMNEQTQQAKKAVIIGGGLIGVEMAEMLHSRGIEVTMMVREKSYWDIVLPKEESAMVTQHIMSRGIILKLNTNVKSINGGNVVESVTTETNEIITTQFVGVTIGVEPNIELAEKSLIQTNRGIVVNSKLETSAADIYAIGDCAEIQKPTLGRKSIEAVWYTGRMMGETVAQTITGNIADYNPGNWFNSAKFFDLEYQTYGNVPTTADEHLLSFYWEDKQIERGFRVVYNKGSEVVVGFNALGLRLRHELCDQWISEGKTFGYVMQNLKELNFDPEFYHKFEKEVSTTFKTNI